MAYHHDDLDSLFQALADPTRRAVLARLATGQSSVSDLARGFDMALPTFLAHLRRLESAGLIATAKDGRVRTCAIRPAAMEPIRNWLDEQHALWETRLDRLERYLATLNKDTEHDQRP